jgi:hypothetical protein
MEWEEGWLPGADGERREKKKGEEGEKDEKPDERGEWGGSEEDEKEKEKQSEKQGEKEGKTTRGEEGEEGEKVKLVPLHDPLSPCPAITPSSNATTVMYMCGHLRSFTFQIAPRLYSSFCRATNPILTILTTRTLGTLPGDVEDQKDGPKNTAVTLKKMARPFPSCTPFFAEILPDEWILQQLPPVLHSLFEGNVKGAATKQDRLVNYNSEMELIARLNLLYFRAAHNTGLAQFRRSTGVAMEPMQLIFKTRPDVLIAMGAPPYHGTYFHKFPALQQALRSRCVCVREREIEIERESEILLECDTECRLG